MTAVLAGLVTFGFTLLLSIAGLGAAFILIPVFLALGVEVHTAMATALLLNAVSMSVASVSFIRNRLVVWKITWPILVVAVLLSPVGARVSQHLDRTILLWLFVGFLLFAASMMLFYTPRPRQTLGSTGALTGVGVGVGGAAGFLGGLLGVGGGNIIVPSLAALGLPTKKASASSAFVVIFASLAGFASHATLGGMDYPLLSLTTAGAAGGATLGAWLMTDKLNARQVKLLIGVVLLAVAARMVWNLV
ncbi:MAG: sulfite exporter TauE/SafE family protein [Dactylosporangium sp.]|nr:sulfite exporter TauE/SafE family protein [Dactylosporangium sp.]NNJ62646.1 sulfite exporter TauE/SafE family protein [Dactylosporangium sp.]